MIYVLELPEAAPPRVWFAFDADDLSRAPCVEAEEAHHLMSGLGFGEAAAQDVRGAVQDVRGAVQYLMAATIGSGKVGVTGYCMGGALTVLASTMVPKADAGVVWYGSRRWSTWTPRRSACR